MLKNEDIKSSYNYKSLLNFCLDYFSPASDFLIIIISHGDKLRIHALKRNLRKLQLTFICETTESINELIFCNHENLEAFLLTEKDGSKESLIPAELLSRMKVHKMVMSSNPESSTSGQFSMESCYRHLTFPDHHPPPAFEYFLRDVSNFEAMIYYTLNTTKIYIGETIAILIPKNNEIYIYIFRRILLNFFLESNFVVKNELEITSTYLHSPESIVKIVVKPFSNLKISEKCLEIKTLPEILKEGFEYYEKAENEKALAISGTPKYLKALEEACSKSLLKPIYSDTVQKIIPTNENKKVVIEIKNNGIRVCVMAKIGAKKNDIIFKYPDNEIFIPMYISFLRKTVIIGKEAVNDYKKNPEFVIFDMLQIAGKTLINPPKINEQWGFQLVPISDSPSARLGFKIHTFNGLKIFPVEIVLALLFKYLLNNIAASHFLSNEFTLRFLQKKLSASEKNVFWAVSKILNLSMILNCEN